MSDKEVFRFKVINDVCEHRLRRVDAAEILNLSVRQIQRLMNRFRENGAVGLMHQARGKTSNNRTTSAYRQTILEIVRDQYSDFSPTLARENLLELHNLPVSNETLRKWMIADDLWIPHAQRKPRVYQPRYRRDCFGELIQIDGSHHDRSVAEYDDQGRIIYPLTFNEGFMRHRKIGLDIEILSPDWKQI